MTQTQNNALAEIVDGLQARVQDPIDVALVLGSGLGAFADGLSNTTTIAYGELPGLPVSKVDGHAGQFVIGHHGGIRVGVMQGRVHLYEGWEPSQLVLGVRALFRLGAKTLIVTNAAGAVTEAVDAGELVVIADHLNMTFRNPLTGPNDDELGPRFPDLQNAYDPGLRELALKAGERIGVPLKQGVYACMPGPSYETPAEIRMVATLGADLVGMSTVPEVIAARHMGVRALGISCTTNRAAGRPGAVLDHEDVKRVANRMKHSFVKLLDAILDDLEKATLEQEKQA